MFGNPVMAEQTKKDLIPYLECEDCGEIQEYIDDKLTRLEDRILIFSQDVFIRSFRDRFILVTRNEIHPQYLAPFREGNRILRIASITNVDLSSSRTW